MSTYGAPAPVAGVPACLARTRGEDHFPAMHTCDDPAGCAVDSLLVDPDELRSELEQAQEALDAVRELIDGNKTKLAERIREALGL